MKQLLNRNNFWKYSNTGNSLLGVFLFLFFAICGLNSCKNDPPENNKYIPEPFNLVIPQGFPPMNIPEDNPLTVEGVALGRNLYYDNILSTNGNSCSSCHHQDEAFTISGPGPDGQGVLAHINLGWKPFFGWNGGEHLLDHVPLADLADGNVFLNANSDSILARFSRSSDYREMFRKAFNINITEVSLDERKKFISQALAQFIRTQISSNSRFDKFRLHLPDADFTPSEFVGYQIFFSEKGDCFHCHSVPLMTDHNFHNNGLDSVFSGASKGRFLVTNDPADIGKFNVPTLRNIELTAPYMHDNRFNTLEEVVEFYNSGVIHSPTVDPVMTKPSRYYGLGLTSTEKADLIAFLKTLTDTVFTNNPALSAP